MPKIVTPYRTGTQNQNIGGQNASKINLEPFHWVKRLLTKQGFLFFQGWQQQTQATLVFFLMYLTRQEQ